jgi:hypothetical protein
LQKRYQILQRSMPQARSRRAIMPVARCRTWTPLLLALLALCAEAGNQHLQLFARWDQIPAIPTGTPPGTPHGNDTLRPAAGSTLGTASAPAGATRCAGGTKLALYPQQAASQDVAWELCRAQHGPSAYLPTQGAVLEAAQAMVQGGQVGCCAACSRPCTQHAQRFQPVCRVASACATPVETGRAFPCCDRS